MCTSKLETDSDSDSDSNLDWGLDFFVLKKEGGNRGNNEISGYRELYRVQTASNIENAMYIRGLVCLAGWLWV